jgi:peptide/nickel transport system substrate-binding protein
VETATTHVLLFNSRKPLFADKRNRLWVSGLIDRKSLIDTFAKGSGIVPKDPYARICKEYAFGLLQIKPQPQLEFNLKKVRPLTLLLHGGTIQRWPYLEISQVIQEILRAYGLESKIEIREAGGYHDSVKKGDFDIAIQPYTLMTGDPDFFYSYFIESNAPRNLGYVNPEADRLIRAARTETSKAERIKIYKRLEKIMNNDAPILPLYHDISIYAHRKEIGEFEMDHFFRPVLTKGLPWK